MKQVDVIDPDCEPRANRTESELQRKVSLLREPHVLPLTQFVQRLRREQDGRLAVPWFDPTDAGVRARMLFLFEAPGPRAVGARGPRPAANGSGFISADNNDQSAANMWDLLRKAGVNRHRDTIAWNIVPWYVGDGRRIRAVTRTDMEEARPALLLLLGLLPNLRAVVTFGRKAERGWAMAGQRLETFAAPHPSPRCLNRWPGARGKILKALAEAMRAAGVER